MAQASPPFYILLAHSSSSNPPNTLGHPSIQYHYTDDSPLSLLPNHSDDHVLVLHYDPKSPETPTVQSVSKDLVVTGLRIEEAPGAAVADETGTRNSAMFIIETTANDPHSVMNASYGDRKPAQETLAQFKHRNSILRQAMQYGTMGQSQAHTTNSDSMPA
ncbi:hypothetical protein BYT27DRAFT_7223390 [Phlegmacium glaucopus]|nr:hypothetical protein BYT27DRAFT_7223390 [Phlegmacium glaucopus]